MEGILDAPLDRQSSREPPQRWLGCRTSLPHTDPQPVRREPLLMPHSRPSCRCLRTAQSGGQWSGRFGALACKSRRSAGVRQSKIFLEKEVRIGIVVEAVNFDPTRCAIQLQRLGQRTVGVEAQGLHRQFASYRLGGVHQASADAEAARGRTYPEPLDFREFTAGSLEADTTDRQAVGRGDKKRSLRPNHVCCVRIARQRNVEPLLEPASKLAVIFPKAIAGIIAFGIIPFTTVDLLG